MPQSTGKLTGFDIKKFREAQRSTAKDPWARNEIWRSTGPFSRRNRFKQPLPGLGIALVAFAGYVAFEYAFLKKDDHHGAGHGEGHGH